MKNLIFLSTAVAGLILSPAAFAGESCSASAAKAEIVQADGANCSAQKANQVAQADGASCEASKATKVALADGASCEASSKAIQVAQKTDCDSKTDCETICDSKTDKVVLARSDTKASAESCNSCDQAKSAPAIADEVDKAPVVVAAQE